MADKQFFPQRPDSHPMIYAYSENNPMYAGGSAYCFIVYRQ